MIFVFGSNEAGVHGAGAAAYAVSHHGAIPYQGFGLQGSSFAIPTKDRNIETLPFNKVKEYVDRFVEYARLEYKKEFQITAIGCGLAGFHNSQIAPLFKDAPDNCYFDEKWKPYLPGKRFWGTF